MGVKLKNALSALSSFGGTKLGSVVFVGSGGPFDVEEGNASILLTLGAQKERRRILVDCGPSVYASLRRMNAMDIDSIIITSASEACMGSLGTLLTHIHYERMAAGRMEAIEVICAPHVADEVRSYLHMCGLGSLSASIVSVTKGLDVRFFDINSKDSAFALCVDGANPMTILYSGRIGVPVFQFVDQETMTALSKDPSNVIVFHDASPTEGSGGCHYERLSERSEEFRNFFIFGHSKEEGAKMIFNQRYMRSMSTNDRNNEFNIEKQLGI